MKMRKNRKEEKQEEDYTWCFFGIAFLFFFLALAAIWQSAETGDRSLSIRLDRLESDNALQQKMIKELGLKGRR
jgi:hypothetical protein